MELLDGQTLREAMHDGGRIEPARAMTILRDVAAALEAAHRRQIVHRDLKPENIWLVAAGERECAKVLDFGLATVVASVDAELPAGDGSIQGTPLYMAPEQIRGEDPHRLWDVWALAVIAFEMLSGVHPFAWPTFVRRDAGAAPEDERLRGLPREAAASFARALAIRAHLRPSSAAMLLSELEQGLHV
jgi:serine/threonine-protein kinase